MPADFKFALRSLAKSPGFTSIALLTLALGISVNTAMFSVLNTFQLRALPYPEGERLVRVYRTSPQSQSWPHSPANFLDYRAQNQVFDKMAAMRGASYSLAEPGQPAERLRGIEVTGDFFPILGVQPLLGRVFSPEEEQPGANRVIVLSHPTWLNRFGGDHAIIGRDVRINSEPVTVIGVMPPDFEDPMLWGRIDAWRPLTFTDQQRQTRDSNYLSVLARLKSGVSLAQAQSALTGLAAQFARAFPATNARNSLRVVPFAFSRQDDIGRKITWFLVGLAGFVQLIACANLANLQFARTAGRAREFAIRAALGASRGRLIRSLLTESVLLGVAGGGAGLVLALWCNDFLSRHIAINDRPGVALPIDWRVLGFTLIASLGTGVAFGLLPALLTSRASVNDALKLGARGNTASRAQHRLRHALIVSEVALALVLLSGAGFFLRGVQRFMLRDPGWRPDGLLTGYVSLPVNKYPDDARRRAFHEQLQERLDALPGVEHAALAGSLPTWSFGVSSNLVVQGRPAPPPGQEMLVYVDSVSPSFFATLGIAFTAGRNFAPTDRADTPAVIVINETMARTLWPGESAIGKRLGSPGDTPNWREVIGVVKDARAAGSLSAPDTRFQMYQALAQKPPGYTVLAVRARTPSETLAAAVRHAVASIDPDQPVHDIATVRHEIDAALSNFSLIGWLLSGFATLGVVLAAVGIYGVIAGFVVQRTAEFGIRVALGAQVSDILRLVLGHGLRLAFAGAALGFAGALGVARLLDVIVPEIPPAETATVVGVTLLLLGIATLACWLPARRATKVDPMTALRAE